ncbi:MAG: hypothetical protein AB7F89_07150 [Pirellulaceae bacterium]
MKSHMVLTALLFVSSSTWATAQEASREDFEEYCRTQQGRWVGEVRWMADWPGLGRKGDKVTCYWEGTRAADGNVLTGTFYGGSGTARSLCYHDTDSKSIREVMVTSGGTVWTSVVFRRGGVWVSKTSGSNPDGSKIETESTLTMTDNGNTATWTGSGTVGGKKTEDQHDVWRRVGP